MATRQKKASGKGVEPKSVGIAPIEQDNGESLEFSVDKGVPMPTKSERDSLVSKFPLLKMDVGDSFLVKRNHSRQVLNSISCSIRQFCKAKKIKHKYSVFKDPQTSFIRVWRSS